MTLNHYDINSNIKHLGRKKENIKIFFFCLLGLKAILGKAT